MFGRLAIAPELPMGGPGKGASPRARQIPHTSRAPSGAHQTWWSGSRPMAVWADGERGLGVSQAVAELHGMMRMPL
jgi:hypothetical protein